MGSLQSARYRGADVPIRDLAQRGKMWALNGVVAHGMAMEPLLHLELGQSHVLEFRNETAWPHPMHLHGHAFRILTRHGNVRYAFFGHVHNTVAATPLISWRYRDTAFVMVPNAANVLRSTDFQETFRSSWGALRVDVDGPDAELTFHTLAGEEVHRVGVASQVADEHPVAHNDRRR